MNISGVTQTAYTLPINQTVPQPPEAQEAWAQAQSLEAASSADVIDVGMAASIQVMDMAMNSFEDAANRLLEEMAAFTGIGQTIDMYA